MRSKVQARRGLLALAACAAVACGDDGAGPAGNGGRGSIVSAVLLGSYTTEQAAGILDATGLGNAFVARHASQMYRVVYRTIDAAGQPAEASAAVYLPVGAGAVPLVSYAHGTATEKDDVPSNPGNLEGFVNGVLQASHGGVLVAADYLGLGERPGLHPYVHAATEASAGLDALRAARKLAAEKGIALDGRLFLYGYSHGGHATLALHREIETSAATEFSVTASAAMAGPYDLYGTSRDVLSDGSANRAQSVYAVYLLSAYQRIYGLAPTLGELLRSPYDTLGVRLQQHGIPFDALYDAVAPVPRENVQPSVVAAVIENPQHPISVALRDNDVYDWRPVAPVRLYYGSADTDVPPQNALTAAARMTALGADVAAIDLGPVDHAGAVLPAYAAARIWFDSF